MGEESKEAETTPSSIETKSSESIDFPDRPYMSVQEAIKAKDYEAILPFIKAAGFNPNQQTMPQNKSVLHELAESTLSIDQVVAISKELLVLGANPNLTDNKQETPLHIAVKSCQYDLASLLIKYGANSMTAFNIDGNLPWHFVDKLGSQEKCERMKEILRVGLEAFIEQEDQQETRKEAPVQSFENWGNLMAPKDDGPTIGPIRKPDNMWSNDAPNSNTWPESLEFGPMAPASTTKSIIGESGDSKFEPIGMRGTGPLGIIGAEIQKKNGSTSPFDSLQSEDSDSNTRWEPAALWDESKPYNDGQLWEEKRPIEEKPKSESREKSSGGLFGKALRDTVRDDVEMRKPVRFGGNSAMDAVVAKSDAIIEQDDLSGVSRLKLKKLCDQYRGKFPRIDGMRDLKDKSIAVLHFSAEQGYNMSITDALDAGVEVNSRRNGKSALLRTIVDGKRVHLDSARLLLRNGADADFQDANGNTFLHLAVSAAHVSAVDAVLRHNPSLELKNNSGLTAWGLAQTKKGGGNVEIVRTMLIQAWKRYKNKRSEEKVDEIDSKLSDTSLSSSSQGILSSSQGDKGGPLQRKSLISAANCGAQDQIKALLADPTIDVNEQSAKGFSALHCAAGQGKIGIVRMLLNYNANPDLQTRDGYTALMLTASSTRAWPEVADALLKAGANPNVRDMNGNTALHHASRNVHVRLVQLLCNRGADVSVRNKQGVQARGVKPWDGKRGWSLTPERWSQETKDAVRDIKNILQEAFGKQKMKNGQDQAIQNVKDIMDQSSNSSSPLLVANEVNSRLRKVAESGKQSPRPSPDAFNRTIVNTMFEGNQGDKMDDQSNTLSRNRSLHIDLLSNTDRCRLM